MEQIKNIKNLILGMLCITPFVLSAQTVDIGYKNAFGFCTGIYSGLTLKTVTKNNNAVEGIVSVWPNNLRFIGLYEVYGATGAPRLNWYYGAGAHVSFYNYGIYNRPPEQPYAGYNYYNRQLGLDLTLGLEYKVPDVPCALSLDIKPYLDFRPYGGYFSPLNPSLGIKVAF